MYSELTRSESDQTLTQSGRWSNEERKAIESDNELADIKLRKSFVSESNLANVIDDGYESSENLLLDPQHVICFYVSLGRCSNVQRSSS